MKLGSKTRKHLGKALDDLDELCGLLRHAAEHVEDAGEDDLLSEVISDLAEQVVDLHGEVLDLLVEDENRNDDDKGEEAL